MQTVIVDRKGAELSLDGRRLRIATGEGKPVFVPLGHIERLIVTASATLQSGLLTALGASGSSVLILSPRDHRRVAIISGPLGKDAAIRMAQYNAIADNDFRLRVARRLAWMKLAGQRRLLLSLRHRPGAGNRLRQSLCLLAQNLQEAQAAPGIASLMGLEGAAAGAYFDALAEVLPASLRFAGRNRRPPRDPVNAMLSLAYTLLHFDAVRAAHMAGLDPGIGFVHAPEHGRESLACDLIEPLRPRADRFVLNLFFNRTLRPEHFSRQQDACLLGKTGRQRFYQEWEAFAAPMRRALRRGVWRLKHVVRQERQ